MYRLLYLPLANRDLAEAVDYIVETLAAPQVALDLLSALDESLSRLQHFPCLSPVYLPVKALEREYRVLPVKNYVVFYTVDEQDKVVEVCRVLHMRRDFATQL